MNVSADDNPDAGERLSDTDVGELLEIYAMVGTRDLSPKRRLHALLNRVAELINARSWLWTYSKLMPGESRPTPLKFLPSRKGVSLKQKIVYAMWVLSDPPENATIASLVRSREHFTQGLHDVMSPEAWRRDASLATFLNRMKFSETLHSVLRLRVDEQGVIYCTCAAFSRDQSQPYFSERDKKIVHLVVQKTLRHFIPEELHPSTEAWPDLRQGLRELVPILAGPCSFDEIAAGRGLSVGTLKTYASEIYKVLGVRDRRELIAMFSIYGTV